MRQVLCISLKQVRSQKNKNLPQQVLGLKVHVPLTTRCWMWRGIVNQGGSDDEAHDCFMGYKGASTVNILALAVAFLRTVSHLKATPCVSSMPTLWTIHHNHFSKTAKIALMIHKIPISRTNYSISRSSIFTSSSRLVVKPLSGLTVCVSVVMVHSASSMGCLKPLTFTGISV